MRFVAAAFPILLALLLVLRVRRTERPPESLLLMVAVGGGIMGALAVYAERIVLAWTDLTFEVSRSGATGALLATFLLAAPLEEGLKVLVVWTLYRRHRVQTARLGLAYAAVTAAGFVAVEGALSSVAPDDGVGLLRLALAAPAALFFAGVWGYALGASHREDRFFTFAWLLATVLHGLYDHILWGRGPGLLVALIPMLLFMALATFMALRGEGETHTVLEPPSLETVRAHLTHGERPLMVRWIIGGAFVTLGLIVVLVVLAVVAGNRLGVDFALADEADVRSSGPLVLLGSAVLSAFPISGYLVARASSGQGLLEPALAAATTLGLLVAMLWLAAPIGVLFALAVAPIALGLACGGAWIGLER
jgi:RsiW-degrading membrane proteinase PrsW (M82 family)